MSEEEPQGREIPLNELDFNSMLANPLWGQEINNPELKKKLTYNNYRTNEKGDLIYNIEEEGNKRVFHPQIEESSEYENLAFISRDFRLGNLKRMSGEREQAEYDTNLAHDCLQSGYKKAFSICLSRVASKLELSQSDGGFFRKIINTFIQDTRKTELEPPKKSLFGGGKKRSEV